MQLRTPVRIWKLAAVLVIIALAAALRLWALPQTPPGFHFDESFEGLEAWHILTDSTYRPIFLPGNFGVVVGFPYLTAATYWLFIQLGGEAGPLAMRTTAALIGIATIPILMGAARELVLHGLLSPRAAVPVALASGASLAGMRWHVHFSRMGIEPILGPLLWAAGIWLLLYGWRVSRTHPNRSLSALIGCGVIAAAAMYAYQGVWILPFILAGAVGILISQRMLTHRTLSLPVRGLLLAFLVAVVLVLPMGLLFAQEPHLLTTRPDQVITGEGNDRTLLQNTIASLGMFLPFGTGDMDPRRNLPGEPALHWLWGLSFFIGIGVSLARLHKPAWLIVWLSWWGLLFPGIISEYAPHFHRILAASAPTAIILGAGFTGLGMALHKFIASARHHSHSAAAPLAAAALLIATLITTATVWDARNYFLRWASRPDLFYAFDEGLWEIAQWRNQFSAHHPATVFVSPRGPEHPTLAFAWRNDAPDAVPHAYDGRHIFPALADSVQQDSLYLVIDHEDFRSPLMLPGIFTEAEVIHRFLDPHGELYATAYLRPAQAELQRSPSHAVDVELHPTLHLLGYDLLPETPAAGGIAYVQLHLQTISPPLSDWTVYLHLIDTDGRQVAGHDARPGQGSLPSTRWGAPWIILDEHQIPLPSDLTPGDYTLYMGIYVTGSPDQLIAPPVVLGTVTVTEAEE